MRPAPECLAVTRLTELLSHLALAENVASSLVLMQTQKAKSTTVNTCIQSIKSVKIYHLYFSLKIGLLNYSTWKYV